MKLYIDTSKREKIIIKLNDVVFESVATSDKSQMLLPFIEKCLEVRGNAFTDIKEISVMTGPGSFTGLRVGVSVAQALGWSLGVPVNGIEFNQKKFIEIHY